PKPNLTAALNRNRPTSRRALDTANLANLPNLPRRPSPDARIRQLPFDTAHAPTLTDTPRGQATAPSNGAIEQRYRSVAREAAAFAAGGSRRANFAPSSLVSELGTGAPWNPVPPPCVRCSGWNSPRSVVIASPGSTALRGVAAVGPRHRGANRTAMGRVGPRC